MKGVNNQHMNHRLRKSLEWIIPEHKESFNIVIFMLYHKSKIYNGFHLKQNKKKKKKKNTQENENKSLSFIKPLHTAS